MALVTTTSVLVVAGCVRPRSPATVLVTAIGDCEWFLPGDGPPSDSDVFDRLGGRVRLSAAVGEVVAFQLLLSAPPGGGRSLGVEFTSLRSSEAVILPENIRMFDPAVTTVDRGAGWMFRRWRRPPRAREFYDALVPLGGPVFVAAGKTRPVWVDIRVPYGTAPGIYECRVIVTEGPETRTRVPLTLRVRSFALPPVSAPVVLAPLSVRPIVDALSPGRSDAFVLRLSEFDSRREAVVRALHDAARLLGDHGLTPYVDDYRPVLKVDAEGAVRVVWDDYDFVVGALLDGRAYEVSSPASFWPLPIDEDQPDPDRYGGYETSEFARVFGAYVSYCADHINESGRPLPGSDMEGPAVLAILPSAAPTAGNYERYARLASIAREVAPGVPLLSTFMPQDMSELGWRGFRRFQFGDLVDIWAPAGRYYDEGALAERRRYPWSAWLRPDEPGYTGSLMIEAPPLDSRTLAWQAFVQDAGVVWMNPVNRWPVAVGRTGADGAGPDHTDALIHPPGEGLSGNGLATLRLKRIRRGVQDVGYLRLLERHGRPETARVLAETLFHFGSVGAYADHFADCRAFGWVEESEPWELARELAADQIERALGTGSSLSRDSQDQELKWRRLQRACRTLRLFVNGVALRFQGAAGGSELAAEAWVTMANELRESLQGVLRFGPVMSGLEADGSRLTGSGVGGSESGVATLPPESRVDLRVQASVPFLPVAPEGHIAVPIRFETGHGEEVLAQARLAYLVPLRLGEPLRVDGDLADWPASVGNSAGGFRLIGGGPAVRDGGDTSDLASQSTRAFVAADDHFLYFGFDCSEERMDGLRVGMSSTVRYDGLTPVGEDLVEIVLDPTNTRTRSTGDVYHVLLKANGLLIAHRGIPCDPPTGEVAPWSEGARAEVQHRSSGWTAEVSIPWGAFPAETRAWPVWGVNLARFEARLAEYSNWAGAKRHIYSPLSMGNLIWPERVRSP